MIVNADTVVAAGSGTVAAAATGTGSRAAGKGIGAGAAGPTLTATGVATAEGTMGAMARGATATCASPNTAGSIRQPIGTSNTGGVSSLISTSTHSTWVRAGRLAQRPMPYATPASNTASSAFVSPVVTSQVMAILRKRRAGRRYAA